MEEIQWVTRADGTAAEAVVPAVPVAADPRRAAARAASPYSASG